MKRLAQKFNFQLRKLWPWHVDIVLNIARYTGKSAEIPVFYSKRYDKCKILPDIILDQYWPIYRHVADISADIRDEISEIHLEGG